MFNHFFLNIWFITMFVGKLLIDALQLQVYSNQVLQEGFTLLYLGLLAVLNLIRCFFKGCHKCKFVHVVFNISLNFV